MLNVKYVVQQDEEGKSYPATNPEANGNAWFISELKKANSADEEIKLLQYADDTVGILADLSSAQHFLNTVPMIRISIT